MIAKIGDRIELHPGCDWWVRGARFGEVTGIVRTRKGTTIYRVKLDRLTRTIRVPEDRIGKVL
jgi:hypothetical protein